MFIKKVLNKKIFLYVFFIYLFSCQKNDSGYIFHNGSIRYWDEWDMKKRDEKKNYRRTRFSYSFDNKGVCREYIWTSSTKDSVYRDDSEKYQTHSIISQRWQLINDSTIQMRNYKFQFKALGMDSIIFESNLGTMLISSPMQSLKGLENDFGYPIFVGIPR